MFIKYLSIFYRRPDDEGGAAADDQVEDKTATEGADDSATADKTAAEAQPDWRDKQIDRQHRAINDHKRKLAEVEAENARLKALAERTMDGDDKTPADKTTVLTEAEVERRAQEKFNLDSYNRDCNAAFAAGKSQYKDKWEPTLKRLSQFSDFASSQEVMQDILATDDPAKVLYDLGSNPDEVQRILDLPPAKRRTEFVKMAIAPKRQVSQLDDPPEPVGGKGGLGQTDDLYNEKLSDEEFYALRSKQKAERFAQRTGRR